MSGDRLTNKWVKISDRLPPLGEYVLIRPPEWSGIPRVTKRRDTGFEKAAEDWEGYYGAEPTHWMSIPPLTADEPSTVRAQAFDVAGGTGASGQCGSGHQLVADIQDAHVLACWCKRCGVRLEGPSCPSFAENRPAFIPLPGQGVDLKWDGPLVQDVDYAVQCRCGWEGKISALKSLPEFKRGCPRCSVEFKPVELRLPQRTVDVR